MDKRKLKISKLFAEGYRSVPLIRLQGIWLEKLGFKSGDYIQVEGKLGNITIKLLESKKETRVD